MRKPNIIVFRAAFGLILRRIDMINDVDFAVFINDENRLVSPWIVRDDDAVGNIQRRGITELMSIWRLPRRPRGAIIRDNHVQSTAALFLRLAAVLHELRRAEATRADDLLGMVRHFFAPAFRTSRSRERQALHCQINAHDVDFHGADIRLVVVDGLL